MHPRLIPMARYRHTAFVFGRKDRRLSCPRLVIERRHQREPRRPDFGKGFLNAVDPTNPLNRIALLQRKVSQVLERAFLQPIQLAAESFLLDLYPSLAALCTIPAFSAFKFIQGRQL
jgi:hypothetical protein